MISLLLAALLSIFGGLGGNFADGVGGGPLGGSPVAPQGVGGGPSGG
ncbi:MAG: hypothetical protein ABI346_01540 [Candidatus Baltobacteraceae bacterium]